jgi:hypothetical protein
MDEKGLGKLLGIAGMDTGILHQLNAAGAKFPRPEFTAQQSSTKLGGETLSTYLFSVKIGGQVLFEAHVSQLGQILRANAPLLGYKLLPDNVPPQ